MRGQGLLLMLLVAAAACGIGWLLLGSAEPAATADVDGGGALEPVVGAVLAVRSPLPRSALLGRGGHGSITGTVTRGGKPVAARIELSVGYLAAPGQPLSWASRDFDAGLPTGGFALDVIAATAAGADGNFAFGGLPPGAFEVVATAGDGATGAAGASLAIDGETTEAEVILRAGSETLAGRAVRADGSPWRGRIAVQQAPLDTWVIGGLRWAETSDDGRFVVSRLEAGPVQVCAIVDRAYCAAARPIRLPYAKEYVLTVDAGLSETRGRVIDDRDGRPVAGAEIFAYTWQSAGFESARALTATDIDGRFRVPAAPGCSWISAVAPRYSRAWRYVPEAGVGGIRGGPGDAAAELDLRLLRSARLTGRVTSDGDGAPVAGIGVYGVPVQGSRSAGQHALTDASGRYEIESVESGTVMVCALGNGWTSKGLAAATREGFNPLAVTLEPDGTAVVDLVVVRAARIAGHVVDAGGVWVRGARVGWKVRDAARAPVVEFDWISAATAAVSDDRGAFVLGTLLPGLDYDLVATASGQSQAFSGPYRAALAASAEPARTGDPAHSVDVEIRFPPLRWLSIAATDEAAGAPIPGARARASWEANGRRDTAWGTTGADGKARIGPLGAGVVKVDVDAEGFLDAPQERLGDDRTNGDLSTEVVLSRGFVVAGHARYADGSPAAGVRVSIDRDGNSRGDTAEADGSFRSTDLKPGTYLVTALAHQGDTSGEPSVPVEAAAGDEHVEVVAPGARPSSLVVRVLDAEGRPVRDGLAFLQFEDKEARAAYVNDGTVLLPAPRCDAFLEIAGNARADEPQSWGARVEGPIPPGTKSLEVRLPIERTVEGTVVATGGGGVRGVHIRAVPVARPKTLDRNSRAHAAAWTDEVGRFRLGGLWAGEYRLEIAAPPEFASIDPLTVQSGATGVEIRLPAPCTAMPAVLDADGSPVPAAEVHIASQREGSNEIESVQATTDSLGVAVFHGLDAARTFSLGVEPPEARLDCMTLGVREWRPSSEPLRLPRGYAVSGTVVGDDGLPVAGVSVTARPAERAARRSPAEAKSSADGAFTIGHLPFGAVSLQATEGLRSRRQSLSITVSAGTTGAVLTLHSAVDLVVHFDGGSGGAIEATARLECERAEMPTQEADVARDGTATFHGVHAGLSHALLLLVPSQPALYAYREAIPAGTTDLHIPLLPAKPVWGTLLASPESMDLRVWTFAGKFQIDAEVDSEGRYRFAGLPDGTWTISAWARGQSLSRGSAEVAAGGTADIDVRPR